MAAASDVEQTKSAAQEALDREAPLVWRPEKPGDEITGVFLRVESGNTQFGPAPVVILLDGDGKERSVWLFAEALRSGFDRTRPTPGETIGIRYLGKEKAKNPSPGKSDTYHNYKVVVADRTAAQQVDWDRTLASADRVAPVNEEEDPF